MKLFTTDRRRQTDGQTPDHEYPISSPMSLRRPSVVIHNAQRSSPKPLCQSKPNFMLPPWVGGTIFCPRHLGHMTKMAATPIYGKNPSKIIFSRTGGPFTKLGMWHRELQPIIVCSNDDPGLTLTYFTARSNLVT